jgi:hypothetical protein
VCGACRDRGRGLFMCPLAQQLSVAQQLQLHWQLQKAAQIVVHHVAHGVLRRVCSSSPGCLRFGSVCCWHASAVQEQALSQYY